MPVRKPLVFVNGEIEQLQAGDTVEGAGASSDDATLTNGGSSAATIGQAVYISAANTFQLARANASATKDPIGLIVTPSIAAAASGVVRKDGTITATTSQWDAVTGQTGGLTPNARYYLSDATAGLITSTPPTSGFVTPVGRAISTTDFDVSIDRSIRL